MLGFDQLSGRRPVIRIGSRQQKPAPNSLRIAYGDDLKVTHHHTRDSLYIF